LQRKKAAKAAFHISGVRFTPQPPLTLRLRLHAARIRLIALLVGLLLGAGFGTADPRDGGVSSPISRDGFSPRSAP
jgi:hypothetical protein